MIVTFHNMFRASIWATVIVSTAGPAQALDLRYYSARTNSQEAAAVFEFEQQADFNAYLTVEGTYDIGLGKITNGAQDPIYIQEADLIPFLKKQRHKKLAVVMLSKFHMWTPNKPDAHAQRAKILLLKAGYKRVVILVGSSNGVTYFSDTDRDDSPTHSEP